MDPETTTARRYDAFVEMSGTWHRAALNNQRAQLEATLQLIKVVARIG